MLKLEAFRALHGDALLLHYGTKAAPRYALIDGGPPQTWCRWLRPGLQALRSERALPLRWIALSHVDDDHVAGLLDLLEEVADARPHPEGATAATTALFHNTPGPPARQAVVAARGGEAPAADERTRLDQRMAAVASGGPPLASVASYRQGTDLANLASKLFVNRNPPKGQRLLAGDELPDDLVGPLRIRVVSPTVDIMERLIDKWEKDLGEHGGVVASSVERKIQNLSSIVLLVEHGRRKMLLTGDALDFDVLAGLRHLGLLGDGDGDTFAVDLLKLPHHGSKANNHDELFRHVKAKHYVISADGRHGNPDEPTLERIVESEKDRKIRIWITNGPGEGGSSHAVLDRRYQRLAALIAEHGASGATVHYPAPAKHSVLIVLAR